MSDAADLTCDQSFRLAVQGRILHADLLEAARKVGSIKEMAEYLGVSDTTLSSWINLRSMPSITGGNHAARWQKKWPEVERKLFELTGKTAGQLFPGFVRVSGLLEREKVFEETHEIPAGDIKALAARSAAYLPAPEANVTREEVREKIDNAFRYLNKAQQEVIRLRFGLNSDGICATLEETARALGVTKERTRQIEMNALRKLRDNHDNGLRDCIQEAFDWNPCPSCATPQPSFRRCAVCDAVICANCVCRGSYCRKCYRAAP